MIPTESPVRRSGARDDPATAGELTQSRSRVGGETFSQEVRSAQDPHSEGTLADIDIAGMGITQGRCGWAASSIRCEYRGCEARRRVEAGGV